MEVNTSALCSSDDLKRMKLLRKSSRRPTLKHVSKCRNFNLLVQEEDTEDIELDTIEDKEQEDSDDEHSEGSVSSSILYITYSTFRFVCYLWPNQVKSLLIKIPLK